MLKMPVLTTAQMIEVDRVMMEDYHISLVQIMENAGRSLAHLARRRFLGGDPRGKKIIVLAGTGSNGGAAFAQLGCTTRRNGDPDSVGERAGRSNPQPGYAFRAGYHLRAGASSNNPRCRDPDAGSAKNGIAHSPSRALRWRTIPG